MPLPMVPAPMTPTFLIVLMGSSQDEREMVIMRVDRRGRHPRPPPGRAAGFPRGRATAATNPGRIRSSPCPQPCLPVAAGVRLFVAAGVALLAACGPAPQGGFHGFPPAAVTTLVLQPRTLPVSYEYVGQTAGLEGSRGAGARDRHSREAALRRRRTAVKAGQPLFLIDPKPLEAQAAAADAEVARARAQLAQAEREVARLKPLAEKRAIGQKEADDAVSNAELARASLKAAEARLAEVNLSLGYTRVNAPITGLSSRANKSEGSLVTANDTLLTHALAGRPDLGAVQRLRKRPAGARTRGRRGPARAAEGQRLRRDGPPVRRLHVPAQGPHQLQRHPRESRDRHLRDARRDRQRRRRAEARASSSASR